MSNTAVIIRNARSGAGLTQAELAARAGTSQPALARYESGAALPTLPTLERILSGCGQRLELNVVSASGQSAPSSVRGLLGIQAEHLRRHRRRLLEAANRSGVRSVRVFGSVARGEEMPGSDIDLLVELNPNRTLVDLAAFRREAREILGTRVDVATADLLKDRFRARALREAMPL